LVPTGTIDITRRGGARQRAFGRALDHPSKLDRRFLEMAAGRTVYLHSMHIVVDWFAGSVR